MATRPKKNEEEELRKPGEPEAPEEEVDDRPRPGPEMFLGDTCATCEYVTMLGPGVPVGVTCTCGNHFHIGAQLLERTDYCITCPSCETETTPLALHERGTPAVVLDEEPAEEAAGG